MPSSSDIIRVEILGTKLQLRAGDNPEAVKKAALYVRDLVHELRERAPSAPSIQLALLTAINVADQLLRMPDQDPAEIDRLLEKANDILSKTGPSPTDFKSEFE